MVKKWSKNIAKKYPKTGWICEFYFPPVTNHEIPMNFPVLLFAGQCLGRTHGANGTCASFSRCLRSWWNGKQPQVEILKDGYFLLFQFFVGQNEKLFIKACESKKNLNGMVSFGFSQIRNTFYKCWAFSFAVLMDKIPHETLQKTTDQLMQDFFHQLYVRLPEAHWWGRDEQYWRDNVLTKTSSPNPQNPQIHCVDRNGFLVGRLLASGKTGLLRCFSWMTSESKPNSLQNRHFGLWTSLINYHASTKIWWMFFLSLLNVLLKLLWRFSSFSMGQLHSCPMLWSPTIFAQGRSGTSSKYWEYRSRSQLHRTALEPLPF